MSSRRPGTKAKYEASGRSRYGTAKYGRWVRELTEQEAENLRRAVNRTLGVDKHSIQRREDIAAFRKQLGSGEQQTQPKDDREPELFKEDS